MMQYLWPSHLYTRLIDTIPTALPWSSGDPSVKGDPRKSVKWIDVSSKADSIPKLYIGTELTIVSATRVSEALLHF